MALKLRSRSKQWIREHEHFVSCATCHREMRLCNTPHGVGYVCGECGARHGAHQKTGEPLGQPAKDKETRQLRVDAHEALDALWRGRGAKMTRDQAYAWLAEEMGLTSTECHIARFDAAQCEIAIRLCEGLE